MKFFNTFFLFIYSGIIFSQISVIPKVVHLTSTATPSAGAISLTVSGGVSPYTYTWTPGNIFTKDISGKVKGKYIVKVKDNISATKTCTYNIGYKTQWADLYNTVQNQDTLKTNATNIIWATALSKNTLAASTNGWFEYVVTSVIGDNTVGFLNSASSVAGDISDIDYGFYCSGNTLFSVNNGTFTNSGVISNGDVLTLERVSSNLYYKKNGVVLATITNTTIPLQLWKLKAGIYNTWSAPIINVGCSFYTLNPAVFDNFVEVMPVTIHTSSLSATNGSIKLTPRVSGTYTYTWLPGGATTSSITTKVAGIYTVTVKDALGHRSTYKYNIAYKTQWDDFYGTVERNDSLIYLNTTTYGTAVSKNTLDANTDGWVENVVNSVMGFKYFGFLDSVSSINGDIADLDYGFYTYYQSLYTFTNGVYVNLGDILRVGDRIRIERLGNTVNYKINEKIVYSITNASISQKAWKLKAQLYGTNIPLVNLGCSFYQTGNTYFSNYVQVEPIIVQSSGLSGNDGSIKLTPKVSGVYTYTWILGGANTSSITVKSAGNYTVTVKDAINHSSTYKYNIGYKTQWDDFYGTVQRNDSLIYLNTTSYGTAVSKNTLAASTDGWVEKVVNSVTDIEIYGFLDSVVNVSGDISDLDYGFYVYYNSLYSITNGVSLNLGNILKVGDVIRIERIGNTVNYKINGILLYTITNSAISQKAWKLKAQLYGTNIPLVNLGCSFYQIGNTYFSNYVQVDPIIVQSSGLSVNDGSIKLTPKVSGAYTYTWMPGGANTSSITIKSAGNYTVTLKDSVNHISTYNYNIGYKTQWEDFYGTVQRNDSLIYLNTTTYGTAVSKNTLNANTDGWVEKVINSVTDIEYYGFSDSIVNSGGDISDLDYGFYIYYHSLYSFANGNALNLGSILNIGDVIRIERIGDTVNYKINGIILYTITNSTISQKAWKLKAQLYSTNIPLVNLGCSFLAPPLSVSSNNNDYVNEQQQGTISLTMAGGSSPYNYVWNDVKYPSPVTAYHNLITDYPAVLIDSVSYKNSIEQLRGITSQSNLLPGLYKTQVFDNLNDSVTIFSVLESKLQTHLSLGIITNTCVLGVKKYSGQYDINYLNGLSLSLQGNYVQGQNYMTFQNIFDLNSFSFVSFNVESTSEKFTLGFVQKDSIVTGSETDMNVNTSFVFNGNGTYNIFANNSSVFSGTVQPADFFTIKTDTVNKKIKFLQNNIVVLNLNISQITNKTNLLLKVAIGSTGSKIKGIKVINTNGLSGFKPVNYISSIITDADCGNPCGGEINAQPNFLYYPGKILSNTFELYNESNVLIDSKINTWGVFTNLCAGKYTVKYYGYNGFITTTILTSAIIEVAYKPTWINTAEVAISGDNSLTKNGGATILNTWTSGASSLNTLLAADNGWIEWTSSNSFAVNGIGFSASDINKDINTIDYGIGIIEHFKFFILTTNQRIFTAYGTPNFRNIYYGNPVFRLEKNKISSTLIFKINSVVIGTVPMDVSKPYALDASLQFLGGVIKHPRVSFGCLDVEQYAILKSKQEGGYYNAYNSKLYFTIDGEYTKSKLKFRVLNHTQSVVISDSFNASFLNNTLFDNGDNRYKLNCGALPVGYYTLEVSNEKNEKLYLRFLR